MNLLEPQCMSCLDMAWDELVVKDNMHCKTSWEISKYVLFVKGVAQHFKDHTWESLHLILHELFRRAGKHLHYGDHDSIQDMYVLCLCGKHVPFCLPQCPWCLRNKSEYDVIALNEKLQLAERETTRAQNSVRTAQEVNCNDFQQTFDDMQKQIAKVQEEAAKQIAEAKEEAVKARNEAAKAQEEAVKAREEAAKAQKEAAEAKATPPLHECVLCLTETPLNKMRVMFPCGHLCVCDKCINTPAHIQQKLRNRCPVCRGDIEQTCKLFC